MEEATLLQGALGKFKAACDEIYAQRTGGGEASGVAGASVTSALIKVGGLKAGNRGCFVALESVQGEVEGAKARVEAQHLRLQNLLYEKDDLQREIARLQGFVTPQTDAIVLVPVGELAGDASRKSVWECRESDPHRFQLNRLGDELKRREELAANLSSLKAESQKMKGDLVASTVKQGRVRGQLEVLMGASTALQDIFAGVDGGVAAEDGVAARHEAARALPSGLYVLYRQLESLQRVNEAGGAGAARGGKGGDAAAAAAGSGGMGDVEIELEARRGAAMGRQGAAGVQLERQESGEIDEDGDEDGGERRSKRARLGDDEQGGANGGADKSPAAPQYALVVTLRGKGGGGGGQGELDRKSAG